VHFCTGTTRKSRRFSGVLLHRRSQLCLEKYQRYHESLNNVTSADAYFGRDEVILLERERIKRQTLNPRHLQHRKAVAQIEQTDEPGTRRVITDFCATLYDDGQ